MQYLADKAGDEALFPRNARTRADITRWQCWEAIHFNSALGTLAFETVAKRKHNVGPPDAGLVEQASANLARFAPVLDQHLHGRRYLVEDRLTLADYSMATFESYVNLVPFDFGPYRQIHAYFARVRESEAWIRAGRSATARPIAA
jgi:glutathione S-transferase